jgi:ATP-binding cassette subfamily B protein
MNRSVAGAAQSASPVTASAAGVASGCRSSNRRENRVDTPTERVVISAPVDRQKNQSRIRRLAHSTLRGALQLVAPSGFARVRAAGRFCFGIGRARRRGSAGLAREGRAVMSVAESPERRLDPIPLEVGRESEEPILEYSADLAPDLTFGERRVEVTNRSVRVVTGTNGSTVELIRYSLSEIKGARTEPLVGGGRLEITVGGRTVPLVEYTAAKSAYFSEIARGIEQLAKGEELSIKRELDRTRCARCNRLLPEKNGLCPACLSRGKVILRLASYLLPYRTAAIAMVLMTLVGALVQLAPPYITKVLIDRVLLPHHNARLLFWLVAALVGIRVVASAAEIWHGKLTAFLAGRITSDIRRHLYQRLERLSLSFYDKKQVGAIMSRMTQDTDRIWGFLVDGLPYVITNVLMLAGILGFTLWMNWKLALLVFSPAPLVVLVGAVFWKRMSIMFHKVGQRWGKFNSLLNESISGIRVVKAFAQEDREMDRFTQRVENLAQAGIKADSFWYVLFGWMSFLTNMGATIAWLGGGLDVIGGRMSLGTLVAFNGYLWLFFGPLQWFSQINNWMSRAFAGAERVFEVIDTPTEAYDAPSAVQMPFIRGDLEFADVRFGYDKSNPVLKGVSLKVQQGEMIGLVGKSGVGKTTLINLICRFYEADSGRILVDGVDIKDIRLADLRRQIGIVLQEPFLFNGTIADNIAYGKPGATFEEIVEAARAANAHNFILGKPDGYDTQVGERGSKLSGGEKQRVSIARAILHDPRILILDEATSSVDVETEKQLQEAIQRLVAGRTTFAIAHRLSTLRNATRLIVLDEGKIAEEGTHQELLDKKGIFHKLVEVQSQSSQIIAVAE